MSILFFTIAVCSGFMPPGDVVVKPIGRGRCTLYVADGTPTDKAPIDWSRPVSQGDLMPTKNELVRRISETKNELQFGAFVGLIAVGFFLAQKIDAFDAKIQGQIQGLSDEIALYNNAVAVVFVGFVAVAFWHLGSSTVKLR